MQSISEAIDDPQVVANGYLQAVAYDPDVEARLVGAPVQFDERTPGLRRAPEHGEHTEEILLELGFDWGTISELKDARAIV
jgi:crotonobetainyl-CoA:carnitine CoA-transferase CaiB-like acyl-CoA transferase